MDCEQPLAVWHGLGPIAAIGGLGMDWELGHRPGVQAFTWTCVQTSVTRHMHRPAVGMCADISAGMDICVPSPCRWLCGRFADATLPIIVMAYIDSYMANLVMDQIRRCGTRISGRRSRASATTRRRRNRPTRSAPLIALSLQLIILYAAGGLQNMVAGVALNRLAACLHAQMTMGRWVERH